MVVLKLVITLFNVTLQNIDWNENILTENVRLNKMIIDEVN